MKIQKQDFNFDRVARVTLFRASPAGSGGKFRVEESVVIEYDPLSIDSKGKRKNGSIARIDFEVNNIGPKNRNQKEGFTANITLYNITDSIAQMIAHDGNFGPDLQSISGTRAREKAWIDYMNSRLQCKLEVGYSNGDGTASFSTIFQGYVNSSFSYRKGQDHITEIKCFNRDDTSAEYPMMCLVYDQNGYTDSVATEQGELSKGLATWDLTVKNIIINKAVRRPDTATIEAGKLNSFLAGAGLKQEDRLISNFGVAIKEEERFESNYQKWFRVVYIKNPGTRERDPVLEIKLATKQTRDFSTTKKDLPSALDDLCGFDGLNLNWELETSPEGDDKRWIYYIWETGRGKKIVDGTKADIKIVNYQNLIEPPTVNGNGNLTVKCMLLPNARPFKTVALQIEDVGRPQDGGANKSYSVVNASQFSNSDLGNNALQSVAGTLSAGNFAPLVQGPYAIAVFNQDKKTKGYLFNKGFPIIKVVHKGSTHSKDWYTTMTTVPMAMGYNPGE